MVAWAWLEKCCQYLADADRAMNNISDDDQSPLAQGLRLLRTRCGMKYQVTVLARLSKGKKFDPAKMEAITTIPASDDSLVALL